MPEKEYPDTDPLPVETTMKVSRAQIARAMEQIGWVHCLVVVAGEQPGKRLTIGEHPLRIGRRPPADWELHDPEVSGLHCSVTMRLGDTSLHVTDENSTNGTFIEGERIEGTRPLPPGALLQVGAQVLRHEHIPRRELEMADELSRDLDKARRYVESLLPAPLETGVIKVRWLYQPSTQLGGDAFGYHFLDGGRFAVYLVDVSGHGAGAAMHSVTIMNVMRQHALPGTDAGSPAQVLERLNAMFRMENHAGMYFTMWYGVLDPARRSLTYASAGHHPSYVRYADRPGLEALRTRNPVIGARDDAKFVQAETLLAPGAELFIFSDGLYEVVDRSGNTWGLEDMVHLLGRYPDIEPVRLYAEVRAAARPGPPEDDVSVVVVKFL